MVARAQEVFPGSTLDPEISFNNWFTALRGRLKTIIASAPDSLVTCLGCQGLGCSGCRDLGKTMIGQVTHDTPEEHQLELACRLLMNARYQSPTQWLPWVDQSIEIICKRWAFVSAQNKPPF